MKKTKKATKEKVKKSKVKDSKKKDDKIKKGRKKEKVDKKKEKLSKKVEKKEKSSKKSKPEKEEKVSKKNKVKEQAEASFNPYAELDSDLDLIDKDLALAGSSLDLSEERMSTGQLALNLVITKGLLPGWYTFYGPEQSCKSTGAMTVIASALESEVPILAYFDYEGSGNHSYIEKMMKTYKIEGSVEDIFGLQDPRTSKWIKKPRVRYQKPHVAEKFFDYVFRLETMLPDKISIGGNWFYVYENTKPNRKLVGDNYDKQYFSKANKFRVPAKDGSLQALVVVDSYPAMLPERLSDDEDAGAGMAAQARMFSEQIKRVKGRLASKRICIVGVNQLRKAPAVRYGNPNYEPCGETLKYFSDCRLEFSPRALSGAPGAKGKGMIEEEPSVTVEGGTDQYRYIFIRATKNKLGTPYLTTWLRLWIKDGNEEARGFDPVFDTFHYLESTNQVEHKARKGIVLKLKGKESKKIKPIDWLTFKKLILGGKKTKVAICEKLGLKAFDLRKFCINQLQNKDGMALYLEAKKAATAKAGSESSDSEGDDD